MFVDRLRDEGASGCPFGSGSLADAEPTAKLAPISVARVLG
jgi:hypothetical protein